MFSKRIISMLLVLALAFTTTSVAFADSCESNDVFEISEFAGESENPEASGWTNWSAVATTYSNSKIESIINSVLFSMLIGGLVGETFTGASAAAAVITGSMEKGDTVYYKTIKYRRFSNKNDGSFQQKQVRYIYSNKARTKLIGIIKTNITTYNSSAKSIGEEE